MTGPSTTNRHRTKLVLWTTMLAGAVAGCVSIAVVPAPNPTEVDRVEFTRMYNSSVRVLRQYGFTVDRQSHRFGVITTRPLLGSTIFEPWRSTNSTSEQAWENTFNQQRRRVTVSLEPSGIGAVPTGSTESSNTGPGAFRLRVEVFIERLQRPDRYLTGATGGHGVYGMLRSPPHELVQRGIEATYWRPLGRDPLLEQRLLADIVRQSLSPEPEPS